MAFKCVLVISYFLQLLTGCDCQLTVYKQYPYLGNYNDMRSAVVQNGVVILSDGSICLTVQVGNGNFTSNFDVIITQGSKTADTSFLATNMQCAQVPPGGTWTMTITLQSMTTSFPVTTIGDLSSSLILLSLSGQRILASDPFNFAWNFDSTTDPSFVCVLVVYGEIGPSDTFGPSSICDKWSRLQQEVLVTHQSDSAVLSVPLAHAYSKSGVYAVGVFGFNGITNGSASLVVQVDDPRPCFPFISLPENSTNITSPLTKYRNEALNFLALLVYPPCDTPQQPSIYDKQWSASRIHMLNRAVDDHLQLNTSQMYSHRNGLRFAPYSLPFGTYKLFFTMSLPSGETRSVFTYFQVIPIPIKAIMYRKQSSVNLGIGQSILLPAQTLSMNPNEPGGNKSMLFDGFQWSCRPLGSNCTFNGTCIPISNSCLQKDISKLRSGSLTLKGSDFVAIGKYEMTLIITKNYSWDGGFGIANLSAKSRLEVEVMEDAIAQNVTIDCGLPQFCGWNDDGIVITAEFGLTLNATCWNCRDSYPLVFYWTIKVVYSNGTVIPFQKDGLGIDGTQTRFLSISPSFFAQFADCDHFQAAISTSNSSSGQTRVKIYLTDTPQPGTCTVSPTKGVAINTMFMIQCSGWSDEDEIEGFAFYYREAWTLDDWKLLSYTKTPWTPISLPQGYYEILAIISDKKGATNRFKLSETIAVDSISLTTLDISAILQQLSYQNDSMQISSMIRAFSATIAEDSKWKGTRLSPIRLDDQPFDYGPVLISQFLGLDVLDLIDAIYASNYSIMPIFNGNPLTPIVVIDDPSTDQTVQNFFHSPYANDTLNMIGLILNISDVPVVSADSKELPIPYPLFLESFQYLNISTNYSMAIDLRPARSVLRQQFDKEIFGLVLIDTHTSLDQTIIITSANISRFISDRIPSIRRDDQHRSAGKLLIIDQNGPMVIDLRANTMAIKFVKLEDPQFGASTLLPVQISWHGVASVVGKHALADSIYMHLLHKLPGASKWVSIQNIADTVATINTIPLPMNEHAMDMIRAVIPKLKTAGFVIEDTAVQVLIKAVLLDVANLMDILNNQTAVAWLPLFQTLQSATDQSDQFKQSGLIIETVIDILNISVRSAINADKHLLEPQSVISQESLTHIATMIDKILSLVQSEIDTITPTDVIDMARRMLRLITLVNRALILSGRTPLLCDRLQSYKTELEFFDTLSSDVYLSDDSNQDLIYRKTAQLRAKKFGARMSVNQLHNLLEVTTVLLSRDKAALENGMNVILNDTGTSMIFISGKPSTILGQTYSFSDGENIQNVTLPLDICQSSCDSHQTILLLLIFIPIDAVKGQNDDINSGTLEITLINPITSVPISITDSPVPIVMHFQPYRSIDDERTSTDYSNHDLHKRDLMNVHKISPPEDGAALLISFRLDDMLPSSACMMLFLKYGSFPGPWTGDYDAVVFLNESSYDEQGYFKWPISSNQISQIGATGSDSYFLGIAVVSNTDTPIPNTTTVTASQWTFYSQITMPSYGLMAEAKYCFFYHELSNTWLTDGCLVSSDISNVVECSCTHMTIFAAGLVSLPLEEASQILLLEKSYQVNLSIYVAMIVISCVYVILSIWTKIRDRADAKLNRSTIHWGNVEQKYEVTVKVDTSAEACPAAEFACILSGDDGESEIQQVNVCFSGGSCKFVVEIPKSLGHLSAFRLWQMSSTGSYFRLLINKISILDLRVGDQFAFDGERCLATIPDSQDSLFALIPIIQVVKFQHYPRLYAVVTKIMQEHLCLSIFTRVQRNRMSRLVRLTCFLSLILAGSALITIWFTLTPSRQLPMETFGPFIITWEQIIVGVLANIFAIPLHILIVQLLKRSKKIRFSALKYMVDPPLPEQLIHESEGYENRKLWPWWCRAIGYALLALTVCGSALLIILLGMQFTDEKARRWLSANVVCFVTSLLVTQPLEIILLSSGFDFFKRLCSRLQADTQSETQTGTKIHQKTPIVKFTDRPKISASKRIMTLGFLAISALAAYTDRTGDSFRLVSHLEKVLDLNEFEKISSADHFWTWMTTTYLPSLRSEWYNGQRPTDLKKFLADKTSRIIGSAEMRQVRSRPSQCNIDYSHDLSPCQGEHGQQTEDIQSYGPGWTPQSKLEARREEYEFKYQSGPITDGRMDSYSPNGYIVSLSPYPANQAGPENLNFTGAMARLRNEGWLDRRTRAIVIDLCAYNFQTDIFVVMKFVLESSISGDSFVPTLSIHPLKFTSREEEKGFYYVHWTLESIFIICVVLYICRQMYNILNDGLKQYFTDLWAYIEMMIILSSICAICFYFQRLSAADAVFNQIKHNYDSADVCISLQYLAQFDISLTISLALVVFGATLKTVHVLNLTSVVGVAVRRMAGQLAAMMLMMLMVDAVFILFFYLAIYNGENAVVDSIALVRFCFGMMVGKGRMKEVFGESSLALFMSFIFTCIHIFLLTGLSSAIALNAYTTTRKRNLAEGHVLTLFERLSSKISRAFLGLPISDRALDVKREILDRKNVQFLDQRMDDLMTRMEQFYLVERKNSAVVDILLEQPPGLDEVQEIGQGPVETNWVIQQDNMYRLEEDT